MQTSNAGNMQNGMDGNDYNVVADWSSVDLVRWAAGIISGAIAGAFAMVVAGICAVTHGFQFSYPVKIFGTILLGYKATDYHSHSGFVAGFVVVGFITIFWGFVFGHFVRTNKIKNLIGMGFTWGAFSWVFMWNLMLHSFKTIGWTTTGPGVALLTCMAYGFGMMVIAVVDPILRGGRGSRQSS